jgi:hypothetical protein
MRRRTFLASVPALAVPAIARANDEEIRIGNIMPYSGPASPLSEVGKAEAAYIRMLNDNGGINGRRLDFITLDDAYSPPKAVEHARRLVEQDRVAMMFSPLGTPSIAATIKYFNDRKVPHLFAISGVSRFSDAKAFPYTVMGLPNYQTEARIFAKLIEKERPGSKIAVLYQNDDLGKDYLVGLRGFFKERYERLVGLLRTHRSHRRLAGDQPQGNRRRCPAHCRHAEVRLASHPQGLRSGLESHDHSQHSLEFSRGDHPARGRRAIGRGNSCGHRQGSR